MPKAAAVRERFLRRAAIDSDYAWLKTHLEYVGTIAERTELASKVASKMSQHIENGRLPFTLGVFGGWGTGKTTFLALLAAELEDRRNCKIVYFNSWKYAGFMEIVPALIYKVLQYGVAGTKEQRDEAARRVLLALGKKYSDQIGDWAQQKIGINPVELFRDAFDLSDTVRQNGALVNEDVIRAYYTQVDKAQDELREALGTVTPGRAPDNPVVVLIDELDRCDPEEAFEVIKQMRVLFGMRDLPVFFVVCANPEPIGQAIKHRFGLKSNEGDYEARRILEKFVDSYEDLMEPTGVGAVIQSMWKGQSLPWIIELDEANFKPQFEDHVMFNATAFDALTTAVRLFSNLRVLHKSYAYVRANVRANEHLLWTKWLLEVTNQMDPKFRGQIRVLATSIRNIVTESYKSLERVRYEVTGDQGKEKIVFRTDKGRTAFSIFRSFFWEQAKNELARLQQSNDPEDEGRRDALDRTLADRSQISFLVLLSLIPFEKAAGFKQLLDSASGSLPALSSEIEKGLKSQFGYELAN